MRRIRHHDKLAQWELEFARAMLVAGEGVVLVKTIERLEISR